MGVFDAKTKTKLAVPDPITDHALPNSKSLSFKAITQPAALAGTKGQQCNLVHGDRWHEVRGSEIENVIVDQKSTISRHQTILVKGNHKETFVGKCYQNIIGPHTVLNNTVRNETRLGTFTKVYGENWTHEHSWGNVSQMDQNYQNIWVLQMANTTMNIESQGLHLEGVLVHGEVVGVHGEAMGLHAEVTLIHFQNDIINADDKAMDLRLKDIETDLHSAELHIKLAESSTELLKVRIGVMELANLIHMYDSIFGTGLVIPTIG